MNFLEKIGWKKQTPLILSESEKHKWPQQIIEYNDLEKKHARFIKDFQKKLDVLEKNAQNLLDENKLSEIPERAQNLSEQHAKTINEQVKKIVQITFTDVLSFQEETENSLEVMGKFREHTNKNISALKEFYETELRELSQAVQEVEDFLIKNSESLDSELSKILAVQEAIENFDEEKTKQLKYEKTLNSYLEKRDAVHQKKQKHLKRIEEQKPLVRKTASFEALEKLKTVEEEIHAILNKYSRLIFDTKHYFIKNNITLSQDTKELFSLLRKDPKGILLRDHKKLKEEFKELHEAITQLENNEKILSRVEEAAKKISEDVRKIESDEPQLHELKKQIMQDIAALNIYEQEQFLLRNKQEEAEIKERIEVISETLDELRVEQYQQELEEEVKRLDAIIRHDEQ